MGRVGLISLFVVESNGLRFLASALRQAGMATDEYYLGYHKHHVARSLDDAEVELLLDQMAARQITVVGLSVRIGALLGQAIELTRRIKARLNVPVVWGGPHVTMAPEECIDFADVLVLGEGEAAMVEVARKLLDGESPSQVDNVRMRMDGEVVVNPLRPLVHDLDELAWPDYHSQADKFWIRDGRMDTGDPLTNDPVYRIMVTRGCVNNCGFCGVSAFRRLYKGQGRFYRVRSVESTLAELEYALRVRPKLRRVRFDDELFVPKREWLEHFCREYKARIGLPFDILSSPKILDDPTIELLADAGLDLVYLGVQTTGAANQRRYERTISDNDVRRCVNKLAACNVRPVVQILIDDPDASLAEKQALLRVLLALPRPYDLLIYSLCHWPGTSRTLQLLEEGRISPDDVEGRNDKVLRQFNADFTYPRPAADELYLALYMLANKQLVPRPLLLWLSNHGYFLENPEQVVALARTVNMGKLVVRGSSALLNGELSLQTVRQWMGNWNNRSLPSI
jgi:anaerobic magnesium-protoporphyrin IX monomethyl ester cyclase